MALLRAGDAGHAAAAGAAPSLQQRHLQGEDGSFRIHDWADWRLEPLGAGWPLSQHMARDLEHALAQASAVRALSAGATAQQAGLAARLHEFERRHARENYQGTANMVAGLLR